MEEVETLAAVAPVMAVEAAVAVMLRRLARVATRHVRDTLVAIGKPAPRKVGVRHQVVGLEAMVSKLRQSLDHPHRHRLARVMRQP